jgi:hypothetical protein
VVECVAKLVSSMSFVVALKTGHDFEVYFSRLADWERRSRRQPDLSQVWVNGDLATGVQGRVWVQAEAPATNSAHYQPASIK